MQEVYNFVVGHYEVILSVLTLVISVVVFILKKKPVNDILTYIYNACIEAVKFIENQDDIKGEKKLNCAVLYVTTALKNMFPKLDIAQYRKTIISVIELILTTPQKKEVN